MSTVTRKIARRRWWATFKEACTWDAILFALLVAVLTAIQLAAIVVPQMRTP